MKTYHAHLSRAILLASLLFLLLAPVTVGAAPLDNHINIKFSATPDQPVVGEDTRLTITLSDAGQQSVTSSSVSIMAEKASSQSAGGHAGMGSNQPMGAMLSATAKATNNKGEYVATMKLTEEGQWRIIVTAGDTTKLFNINAGKPLPGSKPAAAPSTAPAVQGASASVVPMEAVHASYLDLSANLSDLRSRLNQWQQGDEDSLKIAQEKLDRAVAVLGSIIWPGEMTAAIGKTKAAIDPMAKALKAKDVNAAQAASTTIGEASHDVTHAFYPDWLPALQGTRISMMAPHAIYLDLNTNISDLQSRVDQWQKGDEGSLNIAKEKVERIGILVPHMASTGVLLKPVQAIDKTLPDITAALERKDATAAQKALKPIADGSHDLTHDFYSWMNVTSGSSNPTCIQASYLDLSANISGLRTRVDQWQKGDEASLKIAQEKLERIETVLGHAGWPATMSAAISKTAATVEPMKQALEAKDARTAQSVAAALGEGSHDVTHAYYADWLPGAQLGSAVDQIWNLQGMDTSMLASSSHGHEGESGLPNYWFTGTVGAIVLVTIVMVPILRRRELSPQPVEVK